MKKKGLSEETIKFRVYRLNRLLKEGADLENPETVETILATSEWKPAYKRLFIDSYKAYATYRKIEWQKPKTVVPDKEPFLPQEEEVKQLIAGTGKRTSTLLQLLYETGARIGEASSLLWTDIDFKTKQIRINCPEKGSNSRTLEISDALLAMLNALPKRQDNHLFNPRVRTLQSTFAKQRGKLAKQLQNPRIKQIHFHTLRHLKATSEYYKTGGDILRVKYVLGHKRLDTTSKYAHYQAFRSEEYTCKATANNDEASQLIENGFEYVLTTPDGLMLFRKRK
jgi:integrase